MPLVTNPLDGGLIHYKDGGGSGAPVIMQGGVFDTIEILRDSHQTPALQDEFRLIFIDHRGVGASVRPHEPEAYAMPLRVADTVAVLDALGIERAHLTGTSWGARLGFGMAIHAPQRLLSVAIGGQQPYAVNPSGPLASAIARGLDSFLTEGTVAFVELLEDYAGGRVPEPQRSLYAATDPIAMHAASTMLFHEGDLAASLARVDVPALIYCGELDLDFHDQAKQAADEMPNAEFLSLPGLDHLGAHARVDLVVPDILRTLRQGAPRTH